MSVLEFNEQEVRESFSSAPFAVHHSLSEHPLLKLGLARPARRLPAGLAGRAQRGRRAGGAPGRRGSTPRATPGEIARGIETNGCWMVLKFVETDPEYSACPDEALDEVLPVVAAREGKATKKQAFIFLTAPNATTPLHTDPEENFLLQVKAKKQIEIGKWPYVGPSMRTSSATTAAATATSTRCRRTRSASSWSRATACTYRSTPPTG